jgi:hypothetical protein
MSNQIQEPSTGILIGTMKLTNINVPKPNTGQASVRSCMYAIHPISVFRYPAK